MPGWQETGLWTELCFQNIQNTAYEFSSREWGIILKRTKTSRLLRNLDSGWQRWNVHLDHWVGSKGGVIMMKNGRITCRPCIPTRSFTSQAVTPQPDVFPLQSLGSWMVVVIMFAKPIIGGWSVYGHQRLTIIRNFPSQSDRKTRWKLAALNTKMSAA